MGLNTEGGSRTYLKISEGRIAKKVEEGTVGAVKVTSKEGKVSYELRFPSVTGRITHIEKRVGTYGTDLQITLNDGEEEFLLQMPWSSKYSSGFFSCMPNINFNGQVTFSPWMKVINDVKKTALYLTNEGEKENCKWAWDKDNPGKKRLFNRKVHVKATYGLDWSDLVVMYNKAEGRCEVCGTFLELAPDKGERDLAACVDHDHQSGNVRGILCRSCNVALGHFKDSKERVYNAFKYLEKYGP